MHGNGIMGWDCDGHLLPIKEQSGLNALNENGICMAAQAAAAILLTAAASLLAAAAVQVAATT